MTKKNTTNKKNIFFKNKIKNINPSGGSTSFKSENRNQPNLTDYSHNFASNPLIRFNQSIDNGQDPVRVR